MSELLCASQPYPVGAASIIEPTIILFGYLVPLHCSPHLSSPHRPFPLNLNILLMTCLHTVRVSARNSTSHAMGFCYDARRAARA